MDGRRAHLSLLGYCAAKVLPMERLIELMIHMLIIAYCPGIYPERRL
jgi:hypothetical protein